MLELEIEAITDLCLSSSNRTLGQAGTHDFIPGRTLWGALASLAYQSEMTDEEAFRVFHQGAVRIFDAVPMVADARAYPAPASWHYPKDSSDGLHHNFVRQDIRDQHRDVQCKPVKGGWITANGDRVGVEMSHSIRTAVDPSGRARDGLLFSLPVLRAGSRFWSALSASESDLKKLRPLLARNVRLGRSRNAELGIVRIRVRDKPATKLAHGTGNANQVSFLCVSRCLFRDPTTGAPTFQPTAVALGLPPDWNLDLSASFLRTARVVHFNSKRGRPERARFALERGSVLSFKGESSVDLKSVIESVSKGVGEHCGQGYGEILVSPAWLTEPKYQVGMPGEPNVAAAPEPVDELFRWAAKRAASRQATLDLYRDAVEVAQSLRKYRVPPSQWGVIRTMAREARFNGETDLFDRLMSKLSTGKRKLSRAWKNAEPRLRTACETHRGDLPTFLELLAGACMRPDSLPRNGGDEK